MHWHICGGACPLVLGCWRTLALDCCGTPLVWSSNGARNKTSTVGQATIPFLWSTSPKSRLQAAGRRGISQHIQRTFSGTWRYLNGNRVVYESNSLLLQHFLQCLSFSIEYDKIPHQSHHRRDVSVAQSPHCLSSEAVEFQVDSPWGCRRFQHCHQSRKPHYSWIVWSDLGSSEIWAPWTV